MHATCRVLFYDQQHELAVPLQAIGPQLYLRDFFAPLLPPPSARQPTDAPENRAVSLLHLKQTQRNTCNLLQPSYPSKVCKRVRHAAGTEAHQCVC